VIRTATTVFNQHGEPVLTFFNRIQMPANAATVL
jgi:hypothetical protein